MRLPTLNHFNTQIQNLSAQFDQLARLQIQSSSGKKITSSSEDPLLADKIKSVQDYIAQISSFDLSINLAESRTNDKAMVIRQSGECINKTRELLQAAQNETLNNSDRLAIARELEGILTQITSLASTQDANGDYIYSGLKIDTPPFKNEGGKYIYQGGYENSHVTIGLNTRVDYFESGYDVFGAILNGNGVFSVESNIKDNKGTGTIGGAQIINHAAHDNTEYTVSVVTNNSGHLAYQVIDANGNQVIPSPPQSIPSEAPDYIPNADIFINGISIQLSGSPEDGDIFYIKPSEPNIVFNTLQSMINVMKTPVFTDKDKADLKQQLGEFSSTLQQTADHFRSYEVNIGNLGKIVENQRVLAENLKTDQQLILSKLSDADLPGVLSDLSRQLTILQLTQETYLKIQETYFSLLRK